MNALMAWLWACRGLIIAVASSAILPRDLWVVVLIMLFLCPGDR